MKLSVFKRALKFDINIIRTSYAIIIILITIIAFLFILSNYKKSADIISKALDKRDSIIQTSILSMNYDTKEARQLKEQCQIITETKKSYLYIAHRYTSYNYTFTIFFTFFSVLTGILGFILVKNGWDNSENYYLKSTFLISFFFSSLFGLLPNVFGTKENIKNNLTKYHTYTHLQLDLYNLAMDNKGYIKRSTKNSLDSLNMEIVSITKSIKENQDLYFDLYIDKVPVEKNPFSK